ncbi:hypothetical protein CGRA01v4_03276 [Colletotrichum graminicola]|nr:hypothetical protein CGRA01v4_03276 [Colletotrichum graminicola]
MGGGTHPLSECRCPQAWLGRSGTYRFLFLFARVSGSRRRGGGSSQQAASYGLSRDLAIGALCISEPKQTRRLLPLVPARTYRRQVPTCSTAGGRGGGGHGSTEGGGAEGTDGKKHGTDLSIVLVRARV